MLLEHANLPMLVSGIDAIRSAGAGTLSNIMDYKELYSLAEKKDCLILRQDSAMLLLVPCHNSFYDIFYCAQDEQALKNILFEFKSAYHEPWYGRVTIVGKEKQIVPVSRIVEECGFALAKRLARTRIGAMTINANEAFADRRRNDAAKNDNANNLKTSFAAAGDEEEILSLLLEGFDPCNDNLPELDAIRESIEKKEIIVLRKNGIIVSLHYYKVKNHVCQCYYDITKNEYRKSFDFFALWDYRYQYFSKNNITINRYSGWRDPDNKRLMKFSAMINEFPDGVYIYTYKYIPCEESCQEREREREKPMPRMNSPAAQYKAWIVFIPTIMRRQSIRHTA